MNNRLTIGDEGVLTNYSRSLEIDFLKAVATENTGTPVVIGSAYLDASKWPKGTRTVKFRCVLQSTSLNALYAAVADLFDVSDALAAGAPAPVVGSQVTNSAAPSQQVEAKIDANISAIFPSASVVKGVFDARLWIATNPGPAPEFVTCTSAQIVIEW